MGHLKLSPSHELARGSRESLHEHAKPLDLRVPRSHGAELFLTLPRVFHIPLDHLVQMGVVRRQ